MLCSCEPGHHNKRHTNNRTLIKAPIFARKQAIVPPAVALFRLCSANRRNRTHAQQAMCLWRCRFPSFGDVAFILGQLLVSLLDLSYFFLFACNVTSRSSVVAPSGSYLCPKFSDVVERQWGRSSRGQNRSRSHGCESSFFPASYAYYKYDARTGSLTTLVSNGHSRPGSFLLASTREVNFAGYLMFDISTIAWTIGDNAR
ncbi:hypothetical protein F4861DRAFT_261543 [Xylaria intraflava]|nr:hypothetical protein F4861DRAFT_261543 [Xylaria intraflava]